MEKEVNWEEEKEKAADLGKIRREKAKERKARARAKERDSKVNAITAMFGDIANIGAPSQEVEKEVKDWP